MKAFFLLSVFVSVFPVCAEASHSRICSILLSSDFNEDESIAEISRVYSSLVSGLMQSNEQGEEVRRMLSTREFFTIQDRGSSALDFVREGFGHIERVVEARFPRGGQSRERLETALMGVLQGLFQEKQRESDARQEVAQDLYRTRIESAVKKLYARAYPSADFKTIVAHYANNDVWVHREGQGWERWPQEPLSWRWSLHLLPAVDQGLFIAFLKCIQNSVEVWDLSRGVLLRNRPISSRFTASNLFRISSDGQRILIDSTLFELKDLSSDESGEAVGWNFSDGELKAADSELRFALVGKDKHSYLIFDLRDREKTPASFFSLFEFIGADFSGDGRRLLLGVYGGVNKIHQLDSLTGEATGSISLPRAPLKIVSSRDGEKVLFSMISTEVPYKKLYLADFHATKASGGILAMETPIEVEYFRFAFGERIIAASGYSQGKGKTALFDAASGKLMHIIDGMLVPDHPNSTGDRILIKTDARDFEIWNLKDFFNGFDQENRGVL